MTKAIIKLALFLVCMLVVDFSFGSVFSFLKANAKSGAEVENRFVKDSITADVVVFGSSRSLRHYNPYMLQDSLGLVSEVCGINSNGIITMYPRFRQIARRQNPKIVIYDIMPEMDISQEDMTKYLPQLRRNGNDGISAGLIATIDKNDKFKSLSQMYCNNSTLFSLIACYTGAPEDRHKGFHAYTDTMNYEPTNKHVVYEPDTLKMHLFRQLIRDCKDNGTNIVFMVSPAYKKNYYDAAKPIEQLCKEEGVPFVNNNFRKGISDNRDYFHDSVHLNEAGANAYTNLVIKELKNIFSI